MLSDITIGEYYPGNSILHQMDPRMKILLLFFFMIALFVFHSFVSYAALTVCSLFVVLLSRVPIKMVLNPYGRSYGSFSSPSSFISYQHQVNPLERYGFSILQKRVYDRVFLFLYD